MTGLRDSDSGLGSRRVEPPLAPASRALRALDLCVEILVVSDDGMLHLAGDGTNTVCGKASGGRPVSPLVLGEWVACGSCLLGYARAS